MVDRDRRVVVDVPEEWVVDLDERAEFAGKTRADVLRQAIREYLDRDRMARIEGDIADIKDQLADLDAGASEPDTHTHKNMCTTDTTTKASETVAKTRQIAQRLRSNYDHSCSKSDLERCIKDIAGGDPRTIRKYRDELKERALAYEHPNDDAPVWYLDREQWANVAWQYSQQTPNPEGTFKQYCDEYGLDTSDLREELEVARHD